MASSIYSATGIEVEPIVDDQEEESMIDVRHSDVMRACCIGVDVFVVVVAVIVAVRGG